MRNKRTVRPGVLLGGSLLKEESARSLEDCVALESRETLILRGEVVRRASVEGRTGTKIRGICIEEGLEVLCGGTGEVV